MEAVNWVRGSQEAMQMGAVAGSFAMSPGKTALRVVLSKGFFEQLPEAKDVVAIPPNEMPSPSWMQLMSTCATLSVQAYKPEEQRKLPVGFVPAGARSLGLRAAVWYAVKRDDTLFVVIRGSSCVNDWLTDFAAAAVEVPGGMMHVGILESVSVIFAEVCDLVGRHGGPVVFCGHSLGGSVAALLARRARQEQVNATAFAFGPAASVSLSLWEETLEYCDTLVVRGDIVPFLSFHNLAVVSAGRLPPVMAAEVDKAVARRAFRPSTSRRVQWAVNPFEAPAPKLDEVRRGLAAREGTTELFPPGRLWLFDIGGSYLKEAVLKRIPSCEWFSGFVRGIEGTPHVVTVYEECAVQIAGRSLATRPEQ